MLWLLLLPSFESICKVEIVYKMYIIDIEYEQ